MTGESSSTTTNNETPATNPTKLPLPPTLILHATDMTEQMRHSAVTIAEASFKTPVSHGKVYARIADLIRIEFGKCFEAKAREEEEKNYGGGGERKKWGEGSSGWCCVVGDRFGSCVTHRMKTYIHFSVVPGVNVLLWKS
ncbi:hypothetical protein ACHAW6_014563 [Cyclotella cf. meneghiniana]